MTAHQEIYDVAQRVIRLVDAGDPEDAARGFIDYWISRGAYDVMDDRVRAQVMAGMPKLRHEWLATFDALDATLDALAGLRMPIQLIAGSNTTAAAKGVIDIVREIWPAASYAEITGAGHMSPITHADRVNDVIERFLVKHTDRSNSRE
jgi:pimeloyl-ACP methyl ester carboxylesterase